MNKENAKFSVVFEKISKSDNGLSRLYYHRTGEDINDKKRTFSATAVVGDENLLENLKKLEADTEIEIEISVDLDGERLENKLISFCKFNDEKVQNSTTADNIREKITHEVAFS